MKEKRPRSLFFPLALIATGVLWILISMGRIPVQNVWALAHLWPFLLIVAGLGLILRSFWAGSRLLMDVLIVGGAVAAIVFAPQLGWTTPQWNIGSGFNFDGGVAGSGKVITKVREVKTFDAISIVYAAEVIIQQGKSELVEIEAEDNLIPQLSTDVKDGLLQITNKVSDWGERVRPTKPVRITITVKDLHDLDFSGTGSVRVVKLETDTLKAHLTGAGELKLEQIKATTLDCKLGGAGNFAASGTVDMLTLNVSGVGSFSGAELVAQKADVRLSGVGSAKVNVKDDLQATVSGLGSVLYLGNPTGNWNVSGLGSVNAVEK